MQLGPALFLLGLGILSMVWRLSKAAVRSQEGIVYTGSTLLEAKDEEAALRTYRAIDAALSRLLEEGEVERTPAVQSCLDDLSMLILHGIGYRAQSLN